MRNKMNLKISEPHWIRSARRNRLDASMMMMAGIRKSENFSLKWADEATIGIISPTDEDMRIVPKRKHVINS